MDTAAVVESLRTSSPSQVTTSPDWVGIINHVLCTAVFTDSFLFPWTSKNVITLWPLSLSFSQSWKSSTPENCTGSLCKMYYWLPSCIIQSQWTLFDAVSRYCDLIRRQTWVYVAVSVLQSSLRLLFLHKSMVNTPSCVGKTVPNDLNLLWEARGLLMSRSRSFI